MRNFNDLTARIVWARCACVHNFHKVCKVGWQSQNGSASQAQTRTRGVVENQ